MYDFALKDVYIPLHKETNQGVSLASKVHGVRLEHANYIARSQVLAELHGVTRVCLRSLDFSASVSGDSSSLVMAARCFPNRAYSTYVKIAPHPLLTLSCSTRSTRRRRPPRTPRSLGARFNSVLPDLAREVQIDEVGG